MRKIRTCLKKIFDFDTTSTKQVEKKTITNAKLMQFGLQEIPAKNKWLNPEDSFGKLKRGTE
jgi:hypothetical protein